MCKERNSGREKHGFIIRMRNHEQDANQLVLLITRTTTPPSFLLIRLLLLLLLLVLVVMLLQQVMHALLLLSLLRHEGHDESLESDVICNMRIIDDRTDTNEKERSPTSNKKELAAA